MENYNFTVDWFSTCTVNFEELLSHLKGKKDLRFLEIGSYEGRSSTWMLENGPFGENSKLFSVEIDVLPNLRQNLARFGDKVEIFEGGLFDFFKSNTEKFDFIYIDGSHFGPDVLADAVVSFEMLKIGGIILFDDYRIDESSGPKVVQNVTNYKDLTDPILYPRLAIDNFIRLYSEQCEQIDIPNNFQLAIGKTYHTFSQKNLKYYNNEQTTGITDL